MVLGIDACGPAGSVALARGTGNELEVLAETELEGRTYSTTLVAAIADLLASHTFTLNQVSCIVVVNGPGSFTGVRVGLSATKGLSDGAGIPVVAVSRLEVLAHKSGIASAALDAHRHEIFLRFEGRELLAGAAELTGLTAPPECVVCDAISAAILVANWSSTRLVSVPAPTAADALRLAVPLIQSRQFADVASLDGHYLRRSDAEIFGDPTPALRP